MKLIELELASSCLSWNDTHQEYPRDNLMQLFEKKVAENQDKIACVFQNTSMTYDELNKCANQLAHFIQKSGIGSDEKIGIFLDRSLEVVISFLAVMKSGNVYIPMDTDMPDNRLNEIITDANIRLVLTMEKYAKKFLTLTSGTNIKTISIDKEIKKISQEGNTNLSGFPATKMAYIIYTSGTTGKPKGVQISHKSLVNLLTAMEKELNINSSDVLLAITPFTFDLSVPDIYLPLITGGSLVLTNSITRFNPEHIIQCIGQHHISLMQATPTTWQMLVACGWKNESNIKIITGGEALTNQLAAQLIQFSNNVWNFYGPTETTVWSTCCKIEVIDKTRPYVTIGRPLSNTRLYILNEHLQPQRVDTEGELYIGGDGVSEGYVNNQELNEKCFIDDIFSKVPGKKLYKTGDIAKWSAKGELHFIGRSDNQIKIRGYRIEAEAIENILLDYPDINTCIVHDKNPDGTTELVAYITLNTNTTSACMIRKYLKNYFHEYMIPTKFILVDQFPLTFNGKINRKAVLLITNYIILEDIAETSSLKNSLEKEIVGLIQTLIKTKNINPDNNFFNLGLHSLLLVELAEKLNKTFNRTISVVDLFTYPTVRSLADFLNQSDDLSLEEGNPIFSEKKFDHCIAVIGMACKLPGAENTKDYWQMILNKAESISFFDERELFNAGIPGDVINNPDYVPARGIIHDVDQFDASFFGFTPSEACIMDPQHRVFLMQAWAALEDAGYVTEKYPGKIGIFAGMSDSTYLTQNLLKNTTVKADYDQQQMMLATSSHYLCTKVAYAMGLNGPAVTVNTACSTSLVAIAMACDSLKNFQCDMVLSGGITITVPEATGYLYRDYGILSPNGHCHVFDRESKGTVMSNGCGIVVLKRLSDAIKDNDNIVAVIKGWAINNDGKARAGFTAPSVGGQVACIQQAIANANINPLDIGYIEAHGTGTFLGDPIEITALSKAYNKEKKIRQCALGSVKANIGHTDVASGVAGFIKLALALQKKILPSQINFSGTNEQLNLDKSLFYVNCETRPWVQSKCLGAVHSLGFGGTNAHIIVEEAPPSRTTDNRKSANLFILSAHTTFSLIATTSKIQAHLADISNENREQILADMAYTLQIGRKHLRHRLMIVYSGYDELLKTLSSPNINEYISSEPNAEPVNQKIIFGFSGQGTQYVNMTFDLYTNYVVFKNIIDECCEKLLPDLQIDLRDLLFPESGEFEKANEVFGNTLYAQPAIFIIEYAMAQCLIALGIKPTAMIGHSLGEYVAATISGVIDLDSSLKIIASRARLMAETEPGAMLVVPLNKETIFSLLPENLYLAAHNAPRLCVVSGSKNNLIDFEKTLQPLLEKDHLTCKYLHTSHAFHSASMDKIVDEFKEICRSFAFNAPVIPYISNVSGTWIQESDLNNPCYWANHLRDPVLFSEGVQNLALSPEDIFIEIGAGTTLIQLIKQHDSTLQLIPTIPSPNDHKDPGYPFFLQAIGKLWLLKKEIIWPSLYCNEIRKRISLPTYVFDCQSHWIYPDKDEVASKNNINTSIFYTPSWKRDRLHAPTINTLTEVHNEQSCKTWLIFSNNSAHGFIEKMINNQMTYRIQSGDHFDQLTDNSFIINPANKNHYEKLMQSIEIPGDCIILHAWLYNNETINNDTQAMLHGGAYSIMHLSQSFTEIHPQKNLNILVLTSNVYTVLGTESIIPAKASVLGPCKVIPLEQDTVFCKVIDLESKDKITPFMADQLYREALFIDRECAQTEIAWRGGYRWVRFLEPCKEYLEANARRRIKSKGIYLITGGLGGIGLALAKHMAKQYQAHLILISRSSILPEEEWDICLKENNPKNKKVISQLLSLQQIKNTAESLTILQASVTDESQMHAIIHSVLNRFGQIDGVIHAAGIAGGGVAQFKTVEEYHQVLQPKLHGTQVLLNVLQEVPLDFMVLVSSVTSILGYPGQTDYCSANRVLDAFVNTAPFKHPVFFVAMNWQAWRDVGMAAESETKLFQLDETNSNTPSEGVYFFEKILNSDLNQVIISNSDPNLLDIKMTEIDVNYSVPVEPINDTTTNGTIIPTVLNIWRNVLGLTNIQLDDDFYELGGHSLLAISLLAKIRNQFNIKMPASVLFKAKTVRTLSETIESCLQHDESPLVVLKQGGSKPPLFFVHPIGGTVFCYLPLVQMLQDDRTYYGLQDPGIEQGKTLFNGIEEMAAIYLKAIQIIQPKGPYYLCGASFGATVVTEMTYQLLKQNEQVNFVGLLDGWAAFSNVQLDANYIETLKTHQHENAESTFMLSDFENPVLWKIMLQDRLDMMSAYAIKKLNTKLVLFKAKEVLPEYMDIDSKDNHWAEHSTYPMPVYVVPGDHNTMLQAPNVKTLARYIQRSLYADEPSGVAVAAL